MSNLRLIGASLICSLVLAAGVGLGIAQAPPGGDQPGGGTGGPATGGGPAAKPTDKDTDEAYIRRVSLDLRGVEPTPAEVHFFVNSKDAGKRSTLIDLFVKERDGKRLDDEKQKQADKAAQDRDAEKLALEAKRKAAQDALLAEKKKLAQQNQLGGGTGDGGKGPRETGGPDGGASGNAPATDHSLELLKIKVAEAQLTVKEKALLLDAAQDANKTLKGDERIKGERQVNLLKIELERAHLQLREAELNLEAAESRTRKQGQQGGNSIPPGGSQSPPRPK
jgi:hypothetical protein